LALRPYNEAVDSVHHLCSNIETGTHCYTVYHKSIPLDV